MSPVRTRSRRGQGEHLREEIVDVAARLLLSTGNADAVTIRAVANEVGVTPPSIYLHFDDKNALLLAVCERTFEALDRHIEVAVAGVDDPIEELTARGRAYLQFGLDNPEQYRIMFMTRAYTEVPEESMTSGAFEHHFDAVSRACAAGALPADTDPLNAALYLWFGVHGITSLLIAKPEFPWPPLAELIHDMLGTLIRGLRPDP